MRDRFLPIARSIERYNAFQSFKGDSPQARYKRKNLSESVRVRPGTEVRSDYLSAIIGSDRGKRYFLRAAKQTTGIATINMTQLKAFPVLVPPIELQDAYVTFIDQAATTRGALQRRGALVEQLFGSLIARAFSDSMEVPC